MKLFNLLCIAIGLMGHSAAFVLTATPVSRLGISATAASTSLSGETGQALTTPTPSVAGLQLQEAISAPITIAPLTANPVMRRQRCFNDQGFSVDCATWTGYYYTWGPPGNPYEGGPGEGQGGSGSGNSGGNSGLVYQSGSTFLLPTFVSWLGFVLLALLLR